MPNPNRDDESGQYQETYPEDAFLGAITAVDGLAGTQDVADHVGCSTELAYKKLSSLADRGQITTSKIGNARIWQPTADPPGNNPNSTGQQPPTEPAPPARGEYPSGDTPPTQPGADGPSPPPGIDDAITALDVPGSGDKAQERRNAIRAAVSYVHEHGEATPADLREHVYPEHSAQYASARSWWKNCVYKSMSAIAEQDSRLESADTTGVWKWNEPN